MGLMFLGVEWVLLSLLLTDLFFWLQRDMGLKEVEVVRGLCEEIVPFDFVFVLVRIGHAAGVHVVEKECLTWDIGGENVSWRVFTLVPQPLGLWDFLGTVMKN
ncbi:hypothetical protein L1049_004135 [Liquidambar formosana]|uniref:Uncharacterized protein n=1 Tax=Liquidambar formosana TaxID=63359 RepID=A0AAP0RSS1_LIQFO